MRRGLPSGQTDPGGTSSFHQVNSASAKFLWNEYCPPVIPSPQKLLGSGGQPASWSPLTLAATTLGKQNRTFYQTRKCRGCSAPFGQPACPDCEHTQCAVTNRCQHRNILKSRNRKRQSVAKPDITNQRRANEPFFYSHPLFSRRNSDIAP